MNADLFEKSADMHIFIMFMDRYHDHSAEDQVCLMADMGYKLWQLHVFSDM